ncbi:MAG: leucine-rich repeat protein, partial [Clostridia bacterium]|nr:leucine-rich repeat protein [Clostridia bacterium]
PDVSEDNSVAPHTHSYGGWISNETSHWTACDCGEKNQLQEHNFGEWNVISNATETANGSKERSCATCGYKETATIPVLGHTHSYSSSWKTNETSHWKICDCGEKRDLTSHTYGSWSTTKVATCKATGTKQRSCTACGHKETVTISATGDHSYGSWTTTKSATCVEAGSKKRTCSVCSKAETQSIAATGSHTYGDWTITLFPTCVGSGNEQRTCSVCGDVQSISIPPTGEHSYGSSSCFYCGKLKPSEGLSYVQNDSGYTVSRGSCTDSYVVIPDSFNGMPVNQIADFAFSYNTPSNTSTDVWNSTMEKVYIPNSVKYIGRYAFDGCEMLTEVTIPDSVVAMGDVVFGRCVRLETVTLSDSISSIPEYTFIDCISLNDITWGATVTEIGSCAFLDCNSLTTVMLPNTIVYIGIGAFEECDALKTVNLSNSLQVIDNFAFASCPSLDDLVLPSTLYKIGNSAFEHCTNFYGTVIPRSVTQIGSRIFDGCEYIALLGCEATSKPSGWADDWLDGCPADVYWGW